MAEHELLLVLLLEELGGQARGREGSAGELLEVVGAGALLAWVAGCSGHLVALGQA